MKKSNSTLVALSIAGLSIIGNPSYSQTQIWGMTVSGGANNNGTFVMAEPANNVFHSMYSFIDSIGSGPVGNLVFAPNGKFYGITLFGGCQDSCVCFSYDPTTGIFNDFHDFYCNLINGYIPKGNRIPKNWD